jgi:mannose-6-phosphate isomerase
MRGRIEDDGDRPEEWIASTVRARVDGSTGQAEGLSIVEGSGVLFESLVRQHPQKLLGARADFGVLVKLIDSSIRLSAQVHPDKAFARERFGSTSGKTEMWIVLAVRPEANLFIGFRENVTRGRTAAAIDAAEADRSALVSLLNETPARPGDAWLIPGRLPHAIGAGCLILEVQEPTDLTFRPEAWSGQRRLSEFERFAGLDREAALDCFDFGGLPGAKALDACLQKAAAFPAGSSGCRAERIIDRRVCPDFGVNRYHFDSGSSQELMGKPAIIVVTGGSGSVSWDGGSRALAMGDYFFLPFSSGVVSVKAAADLELIECLPPAIT